MPAVRSACSTAWRPPAALARGQPARGAFLQHPGALDPDKEHGFEVELRESGITLQVRNDETLLDALRSANIDECDCREGLCGSCEVPVLEGDIDHRDMVLTRAERGLHQDDELLLARQERQAGAGPVVRAPRPGRQARRPETQKPQGHHRQWGDRIGGRASGRTCLQPDYWLAISSSALRACWMKSIRE
jgi:ferredoxin